MISEILAQPLLAASTSAPAQNAFFYAFNQSDFMGKLVILILLFGSVLTWMIMIEKVIALRKAARLCVKFNGEFAKKVYPIQAMRASKNNASPVSVVYDAGAQQLLEFYELNEEQSDYYGSERCPVRPLSEQEMDAVRTAMSNKVSDQIHLIEERVPVLGTVVSLAPFLGLFGTVWGIMVAFCSLAQLGRASISALAPGVSGALLTTVVGLLVAIPSLIGYNYLTQSIRKITVLMDNFVEEFMAKVKIEQLYASEKDENQRHHQR